MVFNVVIETVDAARPALNDSVTFECESYDVKGDRGIVEFPLTILKAFQDAFALSTGLDGPRVPTLMIDFGGTVRAIDIDVIIDEGTLALSEAKAVEIEDFIIDKTYQADETYLRIGASIIGKAEEFNPTPAKGREGLIDKFNYSWEGEEVKVLHFRIEFHQGITLDLI